MTQVHSAAALLSPSPADRANTINAAIASVKANTKTLSQSYVASHRSQNRIKSKEFDARGQARIMFEKAVRKAEVELMKKQYKSDLESTDNHVKAEALAKVALHRPGSFLTKEEIAHIQQETLQSCPRPPIPICTSWEVMKYRTINGSCNNLYRPNLAVAGSNFRRLIPPHYEDGIQEPRGTLQKLGLVEEGPFDPPVPSAREASRTILTNRTIDDPIHSHMIMQWGQFLDHDLDLAPEQSEEECPLESCEVTEECCPISIVQNPDGDPTFAASERPCLFFPRSIPSCYAPRGEFPPRDQFNAITHYIDASNVYGSSEEVAEALREHVGGRLLVGPPHAPGAQPSLPLLTAADAASPVFLTLCPPPNPECYVAGDIRANEHLGLAIMHTIWVREHNRIVEELAKLDSKLTDEELYQIARKIIGGIMQKIVFEDYLPEVIGRPTVDQLIQGVRGFQPNADPRIPNAYATAAFRYGHSLIRPSFARLGPGYKPIGAGPLNLLDSFFNSSQYNASLGTDPILRGLLTENSRRSDEFINPVLTNALFRTPEDLGRDLAALNINRGRDHGLAPYVVWRDFCVNFYRNTFNICVTPKFRSDLTELHLLRTYGSLDSVDLFPGGMAEAPFEFGGSSSIVGPTFTCIFIINYRSLARGDRFYYLGDAAFTDKQRKEIQKGSLSKVICDNSDGITSLQANAFNVPSPSNPRVPCKSLPVVDLSAFIPAGKCTQTTFMRVTTFGRAVVALAALIDSIRFRLRRDVAYIGFSRETKCIEITCPTNFLRLLAIGFRCRAPQQAPGLPATNSRLRAYDARIPTNQLVAANGFYSSEGACQRGSVNALTLRCGTTVQETEVEFQTIDDEAIFKAINKTYHSGEYTETQEATNLKITSVSAKVEEEVHQEDTTDVKVEQDDLLHSLEEALRGLK